MNGTYAFQKGMTGGRPYSGDFVAEAFSSALLFLDGSEMASPDD